MAAPSPLFNVSLRFDDGNSIYVSKEYLAFHSPVFEAMFFGEFAEKDRREVEIKDVDYEEFFDVLRVLHGIHVVHDENVEMILKLSDQFQIEILVKKCEEFLNGTNSILFTFKRKFELAFKYRLSSLEKDLIDEMTAHEAQAISRSSFYSSLPLSTIKSLFERIVVVGVEAETSCCPNCPSPRYFPPSSP